MVTHCTGWGVSSLLSKFLWLSYGGGTVDQSWSQCQYSEGGECVYLTTIVYNRTHKQFKNLSHYYVCGDHTVLVISEDVSSKHLVTETLSLCL